MKSRQESKRSIKVERPNLTRDGEDLKKVLRRILNQEKMGPLVEFAGLWRDHSVQAQIPFQQT
jgi:hypothetical protein